MDLPIPEAVIPPPSSTAAAGQSGSSAPLETPGINPLDTDDDNIFALLDTADVIDEGTSDGSDATLYTDDPEIDNADEDESPDSYGEGPSSTANSTTGLVREGNPHDT